MKKKIADLCTIHRPDKFSTIVGQEAAVRTLEGLANRKGGFPHAMIFHGPSGTGKTTAALVVADKLGAKEADYTLQVINAGMEGGKDVVREIEQRLNYRPLAGRRQVYVIDEAHGLSKQAQEALLIPVENPRDWVHYIFCTTDPEKVLKTLRSRCTEVKFAGVSEKDLTVLLNQICKREDWKPDPKLFEAIVEAADGSARRAVKSLEACYAIADKGLRLQAVVRGDARQQAIEICRAVAGRKGWAAVREILKGVTDEPEMVRRLVLSYATSMLMNGNPGGYAIIQAFQYNFFDSGRAGLVAACFQACGEVGRGK